MRILLVIKFRTILKVLFGVAVTCLLLVVIQNRWPSHTQNSPPQRKLILFANFPDYYEIEGIQGPHGLARCDALSPTGQPMTCEATVNKQRFNESDAVIFYSHGKTQMDHLGFETRQLVKRPGTTWTFFAVESPANSMNTIFNDVSFHYKFNSTMTYRTDSEFWHGYIRMQRREEPMVAEARRLEEAALRASFRRKKKMSAIFVSNCNTPSRRDKYVREMQKDTSIDVYGRCGRLTCDDRLACDKMLVDDYKFYLAFENSNCFDYVTEKVLNAMLSRRVIPVVRGGAEYARLFPTNSVIDTSTFTSPTHLARHLNKLAENEDEWVKMFEWLWHWEVRGPDLPVCQYCHHLYSHQRSSNLYHNVYEWWSKGTCYPTTDV